MTAVTSPISHAQVQSDQGYSFVIAKTAILLALQERFDALGLGLARIYGDLVGQGSDTIKVTHVDGIGFDEAFTTMAGETDSIPYSGMTVDSDTMTIARHGLRKSATYLNQIADSGRPEAMTLDKLVSMIPDSVMRTVTELTCDTGATFTTAVGTTGVAWDLDDELALVAAFNESEGGAGQVRTVRHPKQFSQLRSALKAAGWYASSADYQGFQSLSDTVGRPGGELNAFLNLQNFQTNRVGTSGGDYQGFAYQDGAIGLVRANTSPVQVANPATALYVPEYGLLVEKAGAAEQATSEFIANLFVGADKLSNTVRLQRRVISGV